MPIWECMVYDNFMIPRKNTIHQTYQIHPTKPVALKLADRLKEKNICQAQTMSNIFKQHQKTTLLFPNLCLMTNYWTSKFLLLLGFEQKLFPKVHGEILASSNHF